MGGARNLQAHENLLALYSEDPRDLEKHFVPLRGTSCFITYQMHVLTFVFCICGPDVTTLDCALTDCRVSFHVSSSV